MSKIPGSAMSLKQFMLRNEVKKLYKHILRTIQEIPDKESQSELKEWVRTDFKKNKHHSDEITIKMMIQHGQKAMKELKTSIDMAR